MKERNHISPGALVQIQFRTPLPLISSYISNHQFAFLYLTQKLITMLDKEMRLINFNFKTEKAVNEEKH